MSDRKTFFGLGCPTSVFFPLTLRKKNNLEIPLQIIFRVVRNRFYIVSSRYGNLKGPVEQNNCIKFELNPLGFRACSVMAALEGQ